MTTAAEPRASTLKKRTRRATCAKGGLQKFRSVRQFFCENASVPSAPCSMNILLNLGNTALAAVAKRSIVKGPNALSNVVNKPGLNLKLSPSCARDK